MSGVKQYNKLVRDRIPEIIEESGKQCVPQKRRNEAALKSEFCCDKSKEKKSCA